MGARSGRNPKSPAFQFYPGDFLADSAVQAMSMEERGVYISLLCIQWIEGGISSDPARLARVCHMSQADFDRVWQVVSAKFGTHPGNPAQLQNPRMERERNYQANYREERAKILAAARAKKGIQTPPQTDGNGTEKAPQEAPKQAPQGSMDRPMTGLSQPYDSSIIESQRLNLNSMDSATLNPNPIPYTLNPICSERAATNAPQPRKRKPASGPHAELIRHWERVWLEARGTPYIFTAKDASQLATALRMAGNELEQAQRRVSRLILSEDTWTRENASPGLLVNRWNQLADPAPGRPRANEPKGFAGIREYLALHGQTDQSTHHSTHQSADQQTQESDQ